jgi:hypothetical protein
VAVREFDGVDDRVTCSPGAFDNYAIGAFTVAAIVKRAANTDNGRILSTYTSTSSRFEVLFNDGSPTDTILLVSRSPLDADSSSTFTVTTTNGWVVCGSDKAAGTNAPRSHRCVMSTGTWTHTNNANTFQDVDGNGTGGHIDLGCESSEPAAFNGRIAVIGLWKRQLSDAEWETLDSSLANWAATSPDALWALNQASTSTPVEDIVGTADETSLTGTTVVTGDDPPGFSFSLGPAPNLFVTRSNLQLR